MATDRLHGIHLGLIAEAESREMCARDGWSVANTLVDEQPETLRTAKATVLLATELTDHDQVTAAQLAPDQGGVRLRVTITLRFDDLVRGLRGAALTGTCETVSPGEARRLACDADVIPAALGSESAVLDLCRQKRLFCGDYPN